MSTKRYNTGHLSEQARVCLHSNLLLPAGLDRTRAFKSSMYVCIYASLSKPHKKSNDTQTKIQMQYQVPSTQVLLGIYFYVTILDVKVYTMQHFYSISPFETRHFNFTQSTLPSSNLLCAQMDFLKHHFLYVNYTAMPHLI